MRTSPASAFKKDRRRGPPLHMEPRAGTKIREVYDLFAANKGRVVETRIRSHGRLIADLCDYYGLDIRNVGHDKWVLAGEWFGRVYIDYIAEHLASLEKREVA